MKFTRTIALSIVAGLGPVAAATLPLDRPTPPPCCADGICPSHAQTFGYFQTRWRVWPGLSQAPLPTVKQPTIRQIPGIQAIEPPRPEEEDRQAPQPIRSLAPPSPATDGPPAGAPPAATPQSLLFDTPNDLGTGTGPPTSPQTPRPTSPGFAPPSGLPFDDEPATGTDTPPAFQLPRSASLSRPPLSAQSASSPASPAGTIRPVSVTTIAPPNRQRRNSDDPPPPPPFSLGNAAY